MINDFLIDFYSKKTDQQIDQDKINLINETYGDDYDLLISDLYSKYDEGGLDDDKLNNIKQNYGLLSSKTVENVEETTGQVDAKEPVKEKTEEITEEDWKSTEEDFIKNNSEKLARLYPDFEFDESTFDFNGVTVKNKITGEEESFDLNTNYAG